MPWLIPTFRRPAALKRLLSTPAVRKAGREVIVKYDPDLDPGAASLIEGEFSGADFLSWPSPNVGAAMSMDWCFRRLPGERFYGFLGDDCEPLDEDLLLDLASAAGDWNIAWDESDLSSLPRHPAIGGALCRAWNFWSVPGLYHRAIDVLWKQFAEEFPQCVRRVPGRMIHHHHLDAAIHPVDQRTKENFPEDDTTRWGDRFNDIDGDILREFMSSHEWNAIRASLRDRDPWSD